MATAAPILDARNTIPAQLDELGMTQGFFAELCGSNKTEFSRMLNGTKPMGGKTEKFYKMLDALKALVKFADPLPLAWREPEQVRQLLEAYDLLPEEKKKEISESMKAGFLSSTGEKHE